MSFAIITPTRGDRPSFSNQYWNIINSQTVSPDDVILMNYEPESNKKDITQRYRRGINKAMDKGHEFVLLWEDDDWYHPLYIEWMIDQWEKKGKPDIFGIEETYYYNLNIDGIMALKHPNRSSAFCTLIKLPYRSTFPPDDYVFFDVWLFKSNSRSSRTQVNISTTKFEDTIMAIGIKHNQGLTGGKGHGTGKAYKTNRKWFEQNCLDYKIYDEIVDTLKVK